MPGVILIGTRTRAGKRPTDRPVEIGGGVPKPTWLEVALLSLCFAICSLQLFVRPYIGLANNGDFPKVFARFACSPPDGFARNFRYFVSDYDFGPQYLWESDVPSSENLLAAIPISLVKAAGAGVFNIRWLGALHLLLFICGYYALLVYLRGRGKFFQLAIGALALWIFTDVAYVSYFNSFFSDTAAFLGLVLMAALALHLTRPNPRLPVLLLFMAAALLFLTSKSQHTLWGILLAAFVAGLPLSRTRRIVSVSLLLAIEAWMLLATPRAYSAQALFSLIFSKIAPAAPSPQAAIREFGLGPAEYRYIGTNSYSPGNPQSAEWFTDFGRRTGFAKALRYWLRHPREAAHALRGDLVYQAPDLRPPNLANYRREDGYAPFSLSHRFSSWSNFRSALYRRWPVHIILWYLVVMAGSLAVLWRRRGRGSAARLCLGVCILALLEFGLTSLADAVETERHLFIFHVMTEITVCFAAAWVLDAMLSLSARRLLATPQTALRPARPSVLPDATAPQPRNVSPAVPSPR
jgi:hypothetical protein